MKKTSTRKKNNVKPPVAGASKSSSANAPGDSKKDEMRAEYRFDYKKAKPNRFAAKFSADTVAVVLDPDVAAVFKSSESVNELLRSVIHAMPEFKRDRRR